MPNISKYCVVCWSGAFASVKVYTMLVPSMGACGVPFTLLGSGSPAASRIVGAMSMTCEN
ncbi:hypothetical protein D3C83_87450 [compost metagenome]